MDTSPYRDKQTEDLATEYTAYHEDITKGEQPMDYESMVRSIDSLLAVIDDSNYLFATIKQMAGQYTGLIYGSMDLYETRAASQQNSLVDKLATDLINTSSLLRGIEKKDTAISPTKLILSVVETRKIIEAYLHSFNYSNLNNSQVSKLLDKFAAQYDRFVNDHSSRMEIVKMLHFAKDLYDYLTITRQQLLIIVTDMKAELAKAEAKDKTSFLPVIKLNDDIGVRETRVEIQGDINTQDQDDIPTEKKE